MPYKDPKKQREYARQYRAANRDKVCAMRRRLRRDNLEKAREYDRNRYAANPERAKVAANKWRAKNMDKYRKIGQAWRAKNHEKVKERKLRYQLLRKYGITLEEYHLLLEIQGGKCAICGKAPRDGEKPLSVDHNHATGRVRGLLCNRCNSGIGFLDDNPENLGRAMQYLQRGM